MSTIIRSVDAAFSIDEIWRHLGYHLNFADLKDCRFVSRTFNQKVLCSTNFLRRSLVTLCRAHLQPDIFGATDVEWKNIRLYTYKSQAKELPIGSWFYPYLSGVEELYINAEDEFEESVALHPPLGEILEAASSLKVLSIDLLYLGQAEVCRQLPFSAGMKETLGNLKELEFAYESVISFRMLHNFGEWLKHLPVIRNLRSFRASKNLLAGTLEAALEEEERQQAKQNLMKMIEATRERLTSLKVQDVPMWTTSTIEQGGRFSNKEFHHLSSLGIRMGETETPNVIQFLMQQPLLKEVDLILFDQFSFELFRVITDRSERLKRLRIKTEAFERFERAAWSFLSEASHLEEISLHTFPKNNQSLNMNFLPSILTNLPPSIEKIHLKWLSSASCAFDFGVLLSPETFSNLNPNKLTELCISRCGGCIDDRILEFIFRTFVFLRVLNISNTHETCTDYGFIGLPAREGVAPFSISSLLGLRSLTLRSCGRISDATLIHGLKFMELRFLDVSKNPRITAGACRAVLANNPSLEILKTRKLDSFESEEGLKRFYHRFQKHDFPDEFYDDSDDPDEILASDDEISVEEAEEVEHEYDNGGFDFDDEVSENDEEINNDFWGDLHDYYSCHEPRW